MDNTTTEEKYKTEQQLQKACFDWFDKKYKAQYRGLLYMNHNNPKDARDGNQLKAMGLKKGNPDMTLALPLWERKFAGLYIELKLTYNKPSPEQVKQMAKLESAGYKCEVIKTLQYFMYVVGTWVKEFEEG
jgi:hypothetical protein